MFAIVAIVVGFKPFASKHKLSPDTPQEVHALLFNCVK